MGPILGEGSIAPIASPAGLGWTRKGAFAFADAVSRGVNPSVAGYAEAGAAMPSSRRTSRVPSTIDRSLARAAHLAV